MLKRNLTTHEIDSIIEDTIKQYYCLNVLPDRMKLQFITNFTQKLKTDLSEIKIYPEGIDILKSKIIQKYKLITPAKSVGIICGQSIGEFNTQSTLNTFHATGIANRTVVQGVPRFLEIIDTNRSETQGTPYSNIYLKTDIKNISDLRTVVGSSIVYYNFENLYLKYIINFEIDEVEDWYPENFIKKNTRICYYMNMELLYRYKITLADIVSKFKNVIVIYSPLFIGRIDIWTDETEVCIIEDKFHPEIIQTKICGIEKIQNMFFIKQQNHWYIQTDGSNLEEILNLPFVDGYNTYSNDIWEMYNLFGIEAVRFYIVEELTNLMPSIHSSHISLLADRMTVSGKLRSISRYTRKLENSSILSKATFEETLSGFIRSALIKEVDHVNGASASIICRKVPKVGTGMNDLIIKP